MQEIFKDDKVANQILNAGKRVSRKRGAPVESTKASPQKKSRALFPGAAETPYEIENALALPSSTASEEELSRIVLLTNRAPLLLAFAACVLRWTMPEQPVSSRLSLAQAAVSANSRSKAVTLGLESGKSAEQEGWGEGQPTISVLGRDIKVMKRWDYNSRDGQPAEESQDAKASSDDVLGQRAPDSELAPPLWGVDTEALKRANKSDKATSAAKALPTHSAQSARSYLLRSFLEPGSEAESQNASPSLNKRSQSQVEVEKEVCLGRLLRSIDLVCQSWASTLSVEDLDRRAWSWYARVRPSVQTGPEGWGEKGVVKISEILALKRDS